METTTTSTARPGSSQGSDSALKKWWPLAALVAVAVAGVIAFLAINGGQSGEGPLSDLGADRIGVSVLLDVGESASISGPYVVKNTSSQPLVLDRVELVGLQSGLVLRGAYIVPYPQPPSGPRPRSATIGAVEGYGLSREDSILHGATVAPHKQIAIVIGVKATKRGRHAWFAVDVIYRLGGHVHTLRTPLAGRICTPKAPYIGSTGRDCTTPTPLKR